MSVPTCLQQRLERADTSACSGGRVDCGEILTSPFGFPGRMAAITACETVGQGCTDAVEVPVIGLWPGVVIVTGHFSRCRRG
jgi:hypothetical protein